MAIIFRDDMIFYLLVALCLTSYPSICGGTATKCDADSTRPETTIPQGRVRGVNMVTYHNRTVCGFMGIPYAQPPVGVLRFKAPVAPSAWHGTLDASNDTEPCAQESNGVIGVEDCLHLNIYTPQLPRGDRSTLLPVMFFVVGGAFQTEDNTHLRYGPDFLLDKNVILVVPNFRVGVLGFLTTGDEVAPGNYGMKDIVRALEWTRDNIMYFGGDPDQVTILGGSSGATSVSLLTMSKLTEGLFHRYITQSGSAFTPLLQVPKEVHVNRSYQLGEYLGCSTNTSTLLVDCLRGLNVSELINTNSLFYVWKSYPSLTWCPTAEPDIEGAFLTDTPTNLVANGIIRDLPWLNLVVRDEGLVGSIPFYQDSTLFEELLKNLHVALPLLMSYADAVDNVTAYTDALVSYYLNDLTANKSLLLTNLTLLYGDILFFYPAFTGLQQRLRVQSTPEYFCSLNYRGVFSYTYYFSGGYTNYSGVVHADDIIYLFKNYKNMMGPSWYKYSEADLIMVETMVELWTSFLINGIPTTMQSTVTWEPYSFSEGYLQIGNGPDVGLEMKYSLLKERMEFLDDLAAAIPFK